MNKLTSVALAMIEFDRGDAKRINHFLKVHAFAKIIAESEGVDSRTLELIEAAAYTHDIGIKPAEEKYHSSAGCYQQSEGPAPARKMLSKIGYDDAFIERVCYIIAHHHEYDNIKGIDYQIVVEADFLVNLCEENSSYESALNVRGKIFKTAAGIKIWDALFGCGK